MMNMHEQLLKHRAKKVASLEKEYETAVDTYRTTTNPVILALMQGSINDKKTDWSLTSNIAWLITNQDIQKPQMHSHKLCVPK